MSSGTAGVPEWPVSFASSLPIFSSGPMAQPPSGGRIIHESAELTQCKNSYYFPKHKGLGYKIMGKNNQKCIHSM